MRAENELINQIRELRNVKPKKDWVISTKNDILKEGPKMSFGFLFKPALAGTLTLCLLGSVFVFAQGSLPGDTLYPFKKVTEKVKLSLASKEEKPTLQLEYASEKLEGLFKVVQTNEVKKVTPIIEEYKANMFEAAKSLRAIKPDLSVIVQRTRQIREKEKEIEALGVRVGDTRELDMALAEIYREEVENWIWASEENLLTEKGEEIFEQVKKDYEEGNYLEALEKILLLSYQQER